MWLNGKIVPTNQRPRKASRMHRSWRTREAAVVGDSMSDDRRERQAFALVLLKSSSRPAA
jgi:hypothetical protein